MLLLIHDDLRLSDLQDRFSLCFPSLRIAFFSRKHHWEQLCPESELLSPDTRIGSIRKIHNQGTLELKSWNKVGEIEKEFNIKFGLNVQIFYKNGSRWIQTGKSDNLTIKALQEKAYIRPASVLL